MEIKFYSISLLIVSAIILGIACLVCYNYITNNVLPTYGIPLILVLVLSFVILLFIAKNRNKFTVTNDYIRYTVGKKLRWEYKWEDVRYYKTEYQIHRGSRGREYRTYHFYLGTVSNHIEIKDIAYPNLYKLSKLLKYYLPNHPNVSLYDELLWFKPKDEL